MKLKKKNYDKWWMYGLTTAWLIATFEHNYFTLSKFSHGMQIFNLPISEISAFLIVLALDLSIFYSVKAIPQTKIMSVSIRGHQSILFISTAISILLNIRYMYTAAPSTGWFDITVAISIGLLIPIFVVIFGWIEGNVAIKRLEYISNSNGVQRAVETEDVVNFFNSNSNASMRDAAKHFNVSVTTIQNRIKEYREQQQSQAA